MSYPVDPYQPGGYGMAAPLITIGTIQVTADMVFTPSGSVPISQASFQLIDQIMWYRKTPTWAVVAAILGFFLLPFFSLLFLLAKEDALSGHLLVTVSGNGVYHQEYIPVQQHWQFNEIVGRVNYAQNLALANQV